MVRFDSAQLWVHDQDEALAFYTEKLGMEVRSDVTVPEMGNFRWLSVGPPEQPEISIVLMPIPGPPMIDETSAAQLADLVAKGYGGTIFLGTEDCRAAFERLSSQGIDFVEEPEERPYGIDSSFRDPSGNHIRLTEIKDNRFG